MGNSVKKLKKHIFIHFQMTPPTYNLSEDKGKLKHFWMFNHYFLHLCQMFTSSMQEYAKVLVLAVLNPMFFKETGRGLTFFCGYEFELYIMYVKVFTKSSSHCSNYTNAPVVIDSESEPEEDMEHTAEERYELLLISISLNCIYGFLI